MRATTAGSLIWGRRGALLERLSKAMVASDLAIVTLFLSCPSASAFLSGTGLRRGGVC
jgi:hypothetical protein